MQRYHDEEWGKPSHSDKVHFEFLILEGAQAGLSWRTVLNRREGYRRAFCNYDWNQVARMTENDVERLVNDTGIIRNRLKIRSAVNNARRFAEVVEEFGSFDNYLWRFTDGKIVDNSPESLAEMASTTDLSDKISRDLKARSFTFVGSTVVYAHLQAVGVVNDHLVGCSHKYAFQ